MAKNDGVNMKVRSYSFTGTIQLICGWSVFLFCILVFLTNSTEGDQIANILFAGFAAIALLVMILGHRRKALVKRFRRYWSIIVLQYENTQERITALSGIGSAQVQKDLVFMIDKGFFNKAYYDPEHKAIIIRDRKTLEQMVEDSTPIVKPPEVITMICPGCGSQNTLLKDGACLCEFCGSTITSTQSS